MKKLFFIMSCLIGCYDCFAAGLGPIITKKYTPASFAIAEKEKSATLMVSENDWTGVKRAAQDLQGDVLKVTGLQTRLLVDQMASSAIIIGTIGKSKLIDALIEKGKINVAGVAGKWESSLIQVVMNPLPGIDSALVIAGSDKRGTIYGVYELSYQIGVSPWHYWADVVPQKSSALYVVSGRHVMASPAVKYRGIFLNDEAPALSGWSYKTFGGFNSKFYTKVFELILRLKGNYLWPAMWGNAFNDDDKLNPILADEYGVVIGTSHHEPLTRAHDEWKRFKGGKWNYDQNPEQLRAFWETGLQRVSDKEQIITVGMRGDGDEPMTEGTATALLEKIVKDQREIIEKVTKKTADQTPQLWALYKEVQDYYDKGMRVPDDVTLLLCDDNWGNIRKLPRLSEKPHPGGYGIYYHFDYVGDPRNYKWINTNPIQKIWEQMNLAYRYNANQIWIVNVGDLKPMEFPIEFFLDYAWAPDAIPAEKLKQYTIDWATKQFGPTYALQIADVMDAYTKYNGRVKPELLNQNTYSLVNYHEFEQVVADFKQIEQQARYIYENMPIELKDAYYQLVLHPVEASANLNELYYVLAKNKLYAKQGRSLTNAMALKADSLFERDAKISYYYNNIMANGKWKHMMDQTHIGYTGWQQPEKNIMPKTYQIDVQKTALGLAIEGSENSWTGKVTVTDTLPVFNFYNNDPSYYIELFNQGNGAIKYNIKAPAYLLIAERSGYITTEKRLNIKVDWAKAPKGKNSINVIISASDGSKINVPITIDHQIIESKNDSFFVENNGYISIEAVNYHRVVNVAPVFWKTLENYGKTTGGMIVIPVTAKEQQLDKSGPYLAYDIYIDKAGDHTLHTFISPTIDFTHTDGLKFGISVDDEMPVMVNISKDYNNEAAWRKSVAESIKIFKTSLRIHKPGKHTLKYWMVSPGVVLQKMVVDLGGLKSSFLGPQETFKVK
jgi:Glycosyl hydrolase family 115/Gylcosyl hydrolase family 115 C-terminal domain